MQLLEAQVEPHFLYNTLAHVVSLIDAEPAVAKRMLDRLIVLLRATASSANRSSTLGAQLDLLRAYLDLIAMRMGPRLAWSIDVAPELASLPVPPMLLQPIVENAIKHGLEPKIAGGRVDVTATACRRRARTDGRRHRARRTRHARRALDGSRPAEPARAPCRALRHARRA